MTYHHSYMDNSNVICMSKGEINTMDEIEPRHEQGAANLLLSFHWTLDCC
uniref:Uncharacterized protein n=1 Tax=Arundo donax TaxID=35708 RepID=A0A0A9C2M2_ARUDO